MENNSWDPDTSQFRQRFWTETDKLKGKHVGNMLSGRWRRSSVSAAAYSSTLTTELLLHSDQILTCLAASVHVTYDSSTNLSADKSKNVKLEIKKIFLCEALCLCIRVGQYGFWRLIFFGWCPRWPVFCANIQYIRQQFLKKLLDQWFSNFFCHAPLSILIFINQLINVQMKIVCKWKLYTKDTDLSCLIENSVYLLHVAR